MQTTVIKQQQQNNNNKKRNTIMILISMSLVIFGLFGLLVCLSGLFACLFCWLKTMVHLHDVILHSRKKELLPFATAWMDLESIVLSEISQAVKDKYYMITQSFLWKPNWQAALQSDLNSKSSFNICHINQYHFEYIFDQFFLFYLDKILSMSSILLFHCTFNL